ncbi:hypothetical protein HAHI6034_03555 [Hathewaya histolytica]|uniref:Uncharacterized protein n=1 Tax=Hathewaya histolytica TaxID=1498 RepID=A0A4U9RAJ6_HATHI|nr:hypothetical protein [Hathewaya histolytica]VTQ85690.1 Uncharacterised protein [Hathewaya histolytica]
MKKANEREVKNRLNELERTMENYVRTERHLEQHSDIASREQLENAKSIQESRREDMQELENSIVHGNDVENNTPEQQLENLKDNYVSTQGYLNHNSENMSREDLSNLKEKQENRKEQMDRMY